MTREPPASDIETPASICRFWFGTDTAARTGPDDAAVAARQAKLWWRKDRETDGVIRRRFAAWLDRAAAGELDDWVATPRGRLALILLTDQFSRNMHRDTAQAFAYDPLARRWCVEGLAAGANAALRPIERVFFCLPLEHSESLADQQRVVALFGRLADEVPDAGRATFDDYTDYAIRHRDIIARFGRFPHRNRLLGRTSTDDEIAFLREPGSSF
ncbi:DUF924 family protein [Azoarcus sp. KH32C]|uniref:DUF924 family protein n=1 Tax=Azoarcus sp. KH32C TaxID=748247 RepID=UPI0002386466|nr:DUF924 family protein [Azoarcus sp. KH32C]BAL22524.1 hypothetical protein AZKH_0178 [Azoarcus sp. KH32C]